MIPEEKYLFWVTFLFYILLLIINPSNKITALAFGLLFIAFYLKLRRFDLSLLFVFIASLIVGTGKTYPIQLLPPGVFPLEIFPDGYFANLVITSSHIISFVMLIYFVRELVLRKSKVLNFRFCLADILLTLFFVFKITSALFGSRNPELSLPFEVLSLGGLVLYFYIRFLINPNGKFWRLLAFVFCALIVFESVLAIAQLAAKSPLYKNLESQVNIEYFGKAVDESEFTFRPVGTFDHANALGIWLASTLVFLFVFVLKGKSNILWTSFLIGFAVLVTTLSRSAWLGFFAGMGFLVFSSRKRELFGELIDKVWKRRLFVIPALIILFFFFVLPRVEKSFYSFGSDSGAVFFRHILIKDAVEIIKMHPIFGVGALMNVYEGIFLNLYTTAASVPLAVHNWYFSTALENGLPALTAFVYFTLVSIRNFWYGPAKKQSFFSSIPAAIFCLSLAAIFQPYINLVMIILLLSAANSVMIGSRK